MMNFLSRTFLKNALAAALGMGAFVVPGYSDTILDYNGGTGGTITVTGTGPTETLTSLSGAPITQVNITGAPDSADNGFWTITGGSISLTLGTTDTFTLSGTFGTCITCVGTPNLGGLNGNLETIVVSGIPYSSSNPPSSTGFYTDTPTQQHFTLAYGTPTSVTELPMLLMDLGLPGNTSTTVLSGSIAAGGTGTPVGSVYTFQPTSNPLDLDLAGAVPEPASFLLFGGGLMGIAWAARRRLAQS